LPLLLTARITKGLKMNIQETIFRIIETDLGNIAKVVINADISGDNINKVLSKKQELTQKLVEFNALVKRVLNN
jgi:hypothetical protein